MKKVVHYIFILASIAFAYNIIQILSLGISNLSEFGTGALLGKILLLVISLLVVLKTKSRKAQNID